jgi:cystathionine beta-lyase/cystathionine gamma-synthase
MSRTEHHFDTRAVHAGVAPDPLTGAILTPIYQSTTFVREGLDDDRPYSYSRGSNPTVSALERRLGDLEGSLPACCFSTGMSALTTLALTLLRPGDRVVAGDVVYGGTYRLLEEVMAPFGIVTEFVDCSDHAALEEALARPTRLLILESPANPTLKLTDIAAAADLGRRAGARVLVDSTFTTPALMRPLELGAEIVVHSTTKYLDGHNATVGGAVCTNDEAFLERLRYLRQATGSIQSPFNAWLTLQGVKTLPLRMRRHSSNALEIARWLEKRPGVDRVHYPWLESNPQLELARRQQTAGGGILSFELAGGLPAASALLETLELGRAAENLGSVETLYTHPASMTHSTVPREYKDRVGVVDGLIRISVGTEDPRDILVDLERALAAAGNAVKRTEAADVA